MRRPEYKIRIPEAFEPMLYPARYKVYHGGRGSAKSWTFADLLVARAYQKPTRILCTREYQNSIEDSVYKLLSDTIERHEIPHFFHKTRSSIEGLNGSEILFEGLHRNTNSIRSLEGIDICWVEEARIVSEESWQVLIPTIRKDESEIWASFNAESEDDPVYRRFVANPPRGAIVRKVTFRDNPWFPKVLRAEMEHDMAADPDLYAHIWEGEPRKMSASQVMHGKWAIEAFDTPENSDFYCGADWGFATDPTAIVRCFIQSNTLYIDKEAGGVGVEIDRTGALMEKVLPNKQWIVRGDSARPETISYLNRQGYRVLPVLKGAGSVEDGIAFLRSFDRIVVHPRCKQTAEEMRLYSYKVNALTGDVLPVVVDAHNHYIDAIRYSLEPLMRQRRAGKVQLRAS